MGTKFTHGVRTTANRTAWVQTGFTPEQAEAEAARLNAKGTLPGVEYVADPVEVKATRERPWKHKDGERYVTVMDNEFYAVDYSLARGNEVFGPFQTEAEAVRA